MLKRELHAIKSKVTGKFIIVSEARAHTGSVLHTHSL